MICPKCKTPTLEQRTTFDSWSAHEPPACSNCHGMWLTKTVLARLIDERPPMVPIVKGIDAADKMVGTCPEGHGELSRAEVAAVPPFNLDRCPTCQGVWFDGGEWQRLASHHMLRRLEGTATDDELQALRELLPEVRDRKAVCTRMEWTIRKLDKDSPLLDGHCEINWREPTS